MFTIGAPEAVNKETPELVDEVLFFVDVFDEELFIFFSEKTGLVMDFNEAVIDCDKVCFEPSLALFTWRLVTDDKKNIRTRIAKTIIKIRYLGSLKNNLLIHSAYQVPEKRATRTV